MPVANTTPTPTPAPTTTTTKTPVAKANTTTAKPVVLTQEQLIQQYQEMVRKREEVDQQINMIINKDSPPMFNLNYSVKPIAIFP
jgi:hypothetical protein